MRAQEVLELAAALHPLSFGLDTCSQTLTPSDILGKMKPANQHTTPQSPTHKWPGHKQNATTTEPNTNWPCPSDRANTNDKSNGATCGANVSICSHRHVEPQVLQSQASLRASSDTRTGHSLCGSGRATTTRQHLTDA